MLLKIRQGKLNFTKLQKTKKIVEEHESSSNSDTMVDIENYKENSAQI